MSLAFSKVLKFLTHSTLIGYSDALKWLLLNCRDSGDIYSMQNSCFEFKLPPHPTSLAPLKIHNVSWSHRYVSQPRSWSQAWMTCLGLHDHLSPSVSSNEGHLPLWQSPSFHIPNKMLLRWVIFSYEIIFGGTCEAMSCVSLLASLEIVLT